MLLFDEHATCRKCGSQDVFAIYVKADERLDYNDRREGESSWSKTSHILRRCERCRHTWRERPLDQATELEIAQRAAGAEKASR